ncbi:hypothetical protein DFH09DRAFT_1370912 [Mycena vulgaris]|nr:hypothetical protein DFH09DRAFT_1370912 [Mycena vulgaris]
MSKLPRFLQYPAQRDRSKSLSGDPPPSAASSGASHATSNSTSTSTCGGGRRSAGRFLGLGKHARERQRIRDAERAAPSAAELLTIREVSPTSYAPPTFYDEPHDSPPSTYGGTARPCTRPEWHFSASTPPHPHIRTLPRRGTATSRGRRYNSSAHPAASALTHIRLVPRVHHLGALSHSVSTATALASSTTKRGSKDVSSSGGSGGGGAGKTSLLDKPLRYLLNGDAAPDRSANEIWLMGDEEPAAASNAHPHSTSHKAHSTSHSTSHNGNSRSTAQAQALEGDVDAGPWPAQFHATFYAQVWCTYRAGFKPIRDLPSLATLSPSLSFSAPPPSTSSHSTSTPHPNSNPNSSTPNLTSSSHTAVPSAHQHPHPHHAPGMHHSPSQSDSSYSSVDSTSSYGSGKGARYSYSTSGSNNSNASYNSTSASFASGTNKKKWWPLGAAPRGRRVTRGGGAYSARGRVCWRRRCSALGNRLSHQPPRRCSHQLRRPRTPHTCASSPGSSTQQRRPSAYIEWRSLARPRGRTWACGLDPVPRRGR